ncbi:MAG: glycoside hydrolase family 3 C-terminal domain-containing protein [Gammaproteobacteria bacterium]|nr:glycoside hydrolase family 3 C-terminal domain-containing protein [Gammaproteobacteria bacterium]MBU2056643.1 glycoside hydrolase family 3 C-terminal domain-containing protein [Gammaproteobacteria bacterium]MBU2173980.1 glycoside hydrolase family 3 C-terminal domain-containing protein [Gammaproteobacteria bacterium]MBU2247286.1 glycoside hydrolase family 3 C-terminal domain-containing protein [Gammaproteobacteria bacterium]MBU2344944.1 glycoside hydrolase family 3 C-terminal domain-containin
MISMKRSISLLSLLTLSLSPYAAAQPVDKSAVEWPYVNTGLKRDPELEKVLDQILERMTLAQKVAQMIQPEIGYLSVAQMRKYGFGSYLNGGNTAPYGQKRASAEVWLKYADEMYEASVDAKEDGSRIPTIWGTDAMHGHSNVYGATLFPHNIGLGAANDPELIHRIGVATAKEVAVTGIEWSFAPTVAVVRDDRWGRTYESYSEDPAIVKAYAGQMVSGLQGTLGKDFLQGFGRIATAKHFVGDGGTEKGIDRGDTLVDEQGLRDIHAAGYMTAIQAGVQSVMVSFNSWNGVRLHGHKYLLTDVLKNQMGFDGFVVTDWNGHKFVEGCDLEQCAGAINAGVDVLMVPEHFEAFYHNTIRQVEQGIIPMTRIDDAVRRFLRAKIRWGLLERGKPSSRVESAQMAVFNSQEHKDLAREAVRKSLVLLKNNQKVLPLSAKSRLLVAGDGADNIAKQAGGWSVSWQGTDNSNADFPNATSVYQGLRQQVEAAGGKVELAVDGNYSQKPDVAVVVIGENPYAEWFGDIQQLEYQHGDKSDLALIKKLKSQGIPVVTVFLTGRPLWTNKELNASDAFVVAWLPGSEGQGVADVLLADSQGKARYDFQGKLSFSWPGSDDQFVLNKGETNYDPLFAYGYGLTYANHTEPGLLSEQVSATAASSSDDGIQPLFLRNLSADMAWVLSDSSATGALNTAALITTPYGVSADGKSLAMQSVNLSYQEDGRQLRWNTTAKASASLRYIKPVAASKYKTAKALRFSLRFDQHLPSELSLAVLCDQQGQCQRQLSLTKPLAHLKPGLWHTVELALDCADASAVKRISDALVFSSSGQHSLAVADIVLAAQISTEAAQGTVLIGCAN